MDLSAALAELAAVRSELASTKDDLAAARSSLAATERVAAVALRALRSTGPAMPEGLWLRERDLDVMRRLQGSVDEGEKEPQGSGGDFAISFDRLEALLLPEDTPAKVPRLFPRAFPMEIVLLIGRMAAEDSRATVAALCRVSFGCLELFSRSHLYHDVGLLRAGTFELLFKTPRLQGSRLTRHLALDNIRHLQVERCTLCNKPPVIPAPLALETFTLYASSDDDPDPDREDFSLPGLALFNPITIHLFWAANRQCGSLLIDYLYPSDPLREWNRLSHVFVHDLCLWDLKTESLVFQTIPSPPRRAGTLSISWTVEASPRQSNRDRISCILTHYGHPRLNGHWIGSVSLVFRSAIQLEASRAHLEEQLAKVDESWRSIISCEVLS